MLFEQRLWAGLADGSVTVIFRRWRRRGPGRGRGTGLAGILAVDAVAEVDPAAISEDDARAAGFASLAELRRRLDRAGRDGPWTAATLRLIGDRPGGAGRLSARRPSAGSGTRSRPTCASSRSWG